jgi:tRNA1Val (adenine37-N6)-methyltransferase
MDSETTLTAFLRGRIRVRQPKNGYRFNVDSVALAGFAWLRDGERVLDLGTGSGILLLLLGHYHHPASLTGIELQENLASMASSNLSENGWEERGQVLHGDLRDPSTLERGAFDLVVCNPPYHEAGRGQTSSTPQRALAKQSFSAEFADVAAAASRALAPGGRFCAVAPFARRDDLLAALGGAGLHPAVTRSVRDAPGSKAHLVLLQAGLLPGMGCLSLPPLVLKDENGAYGPEMRRWLNHEAPAGPAFFCDCMLGTLARYLRLLGADTAYARKAEDDWLMGECRRSGRVLLTRDRPLLSLCSKAGLPALDPGSDVPREQFAAVRKALPAPSPGTPRCLRCNAPTTALDREEARGKVPPYTYLTRKRFTACPCCAKITWEGSHLERFRKDVWEARKRGS